MKSYAGESHYNGKYLIKEGFVYHDTPYYRVIITATGEESCLGTIEECREIIEHAERGELKGSFGLGVNAA